LEDAPLSKNHHMLRGNKNTFGFAQGIYYDASKPTRVMPSAVASAFGARLDWLFPGVLSLSARGCLISKPPVQVVSLETGSRMNGIKKGWFVKTARELHGSRLLRAAGKGWAVGMSEEVLHPAVLPPSAGC
jgi:hypothetical protein